MTNSPPRKASDYQLTDDERLRMSGPGLRAALRIGDLWDLSKEEVIKVLSVDDEATFEEWIDQAQSKREIILPTHVLFRISVLLGIFSNLSRILQDELSIASWIRMPNTNPFFAGAAPITHLCDPDNEKFLSLREHLYREIFRL